MKTTYASYSQRTGAPRLVRLHDDNKEIIQGPLRLQEEWIDMGTGKRTWHEVPIVERHPEKMFDAE